jgi:hypothetical protein
MHLPRRNTHRTSRPRTAEQVRTQNCAIPALRQRYFAQAGATASHLGVSFERVMQHLWDARRRQMVVPIRSIACLDDLVLAVACVDNSDRAWHELTELYEPWLVRRGRRVIGGPTAVLIVRQLIVELRRAEPAEEVNQSLHDYLGVQPLREWLAGRLWRRLACRTGAQPSLAPVVDAHG